MSNFGIITLFSGRLFSAHVALLFYNTYVIRELGEGEAETTALAVCILNVFLSFLSRVSMQCMQSAILFYEVYPSVLSVRLFVRPMPLLCLNE